MLTKEIVIIVAEDDEGHASLIVRNLKRAVIVNDIICFSDGEETLNFLMRNGDSPHHTTDTGYILLLDIRMPKVDGIEVLRQIKKHHELSKIPVTMITTTDDPREIQECHLLGCNNYIKKPVDYQEFVEVIKQLGLFLLVVEIPKIKGR